MATTEKRRHDLFNRAAEVFGPSEAETMMELIGPATWSDFATRADVDGVHTEMADLRTEMATLSSDLRNEMATLGSDLRTEMATLSSDLRNEMATLGSDLRLEMEQRFGIMTKTFVTWMLASQATFATLVAVFITVAH